MVDFAIRASSIPPTGRFIRPNAIFIAPTGICTPRFCLKGDLCDSFDFYDFACGTSWWYVTVVRDDGLHPSLVLAATSWLGVVEAKTI